MASAHLSAKIISRGSGHSAVAKAAYNAREELEDRRTGETHDYTRHSSKCLFQGIYAPKGAPEWAHDRTQLWNHVEAFERHRRAQLAQDIDIALPHELTLEQNRYLLQDWVKENVTRKGLIADVAIHAPDRRGDGRNIHAHVMIVMRKLDGSEFVRAKERFDTLGEKQAAQKADLTAMRESWEKLANRHLERHGHEARINMGRKEDGEATLHMGRHATAQERRGKASEIGDLNREITAANENAKRMQKGFDDYQASRRQIRKDVREHLADHAARDPGLLERGRREAEREVQAERAADRSDRTHASPERPRGGNPRPGRSSGPGEAGRALGRGAGLLGEGAGKAVGGGLGLVGGLLGAMLGGGAKSSPPAKSAQPVKERPPSRLDEIEARARAKAAEAAKQPSPERDKERDRDNTRSRFVEVRPTTRLMGALGQYAGWAVEAKKRLWAYAMRTGEDVSAGLRELDEIIYFADHPKPT